MRSTRHLRESVLMAAGLMALLIFAGVAAAQNTARTLVIDRSGNEIDTVAPGPDNEEVMILSSRGAWLGVRLADVTAEKVSELKLKEESGAIVTEVELASPAAKAGLQPNDVILEYQGERVESVAQLTRFVRETPPGRTVRLVVSRNGQRQTLTAKLEQRGPARSELRIPPIRVPEIHVPPIEVPDFDVEVFQTGPRLGISAQALTPQLAEYFGVKQGKGVLVTEVREGSPAAKAGVKAGDVIVKLDDQAIENVSGLRRVLRGKKGGETATLVVVRQRNEQTLKVQLEESRGMEHPVSGRTFDTEQLLRDYRASLERLKQEMQALKANLQQALAEKQRNVQQELLRLQQQLRQRVTSL